MSDFEIVRQRMMQQDKFIDLLRLKVAALENILISYLPDFERLYATELEKLRVTNQDKDASAD